ncbi:hypothetical protein [Acinetobacter puyangensis]|uniref:hypothetical protein n=1 Tax=Acinetobacter puyangensis TaxID=1096779 RepID=UPI003A4E5F3E
MKALANPNQSLNPEQKNDETGLDERTDQERREDFERELERVRYNINQPYEFDATQYNYEIKQVPILAGCMIMNNTCNCYTQQATKIDMSQKDCKRYMNGDKPFNPFLDARNNQNQQQTMQNNQFVQQQYQPVQPVY